MITSHEIVRRTGLSFRQIDHWCRAGYLRPAERHSESQGVPREFPDAELGAALRMRDLVGCGFTVAAAAKLARGDRDALAKVDLVLAAVRFSAGATGSSAQRTVTT